MNKINDFNTKYEKLAQAEIPEGNDLWSESPSPKMASDFTVLDRNDLWLDSSALESTSDCPILFSLRPPNQVI